jgi:hypothetical protein
VKLDIESYTYDATGAFCPRELSSAHRGSSVADCPPLLADSDPASAAAKVVRVSVPASVGLPLVKRQFSGSHLRGVRADETAESVALHSHLTTSDSLTKRAVERLHPAESDLSLERNAELPPRGLLSPDEAATRFGCVPRRLPPMASELSSQPGWVRRHYEAVRTAASRGAAVNGGGNTSADTEGLLCSLTAFRHELQVMEARRRWLAASIAMNPDAACPPVRADGTATERYPSAVR